MKKEQERMNEFAEFMGERFPIYAKGLWEFLHDNGFFTAPASTKYHGNYEGGLFDHSYQVAQTLVQLTKDMNLQWEREISPYIIGMFHDLCKIDIYKKVVDDEGIQMMGSDEVIGEMSHFVYDDTSLLSGHGNKSVMMLARFMQLTEEEILCIRYHMGAYETDDWDKFGKSIEKYPNVLYTHMSDMIASRVKGV